MMHRLLALATLGLLFAATHACAAPTVTLAPAAVAAGQPAFVRIDDDDGCFEFDESTVKRNGNAVVVEVLVSDQVLSPCLPRHVTPVLLPLGAFEPGAYGVDVQFCGALPFNPCTRFVLLGLEVGAPARRHAIPAFGVVALLLSCSGVFALAFTSRRSAPRR